uniref:Uncharacterized protein n=1 Tax=Lepeophtheirus salmonis TaxID=72036 RepID=A0A0K2VC61_LEPSM
MFKSRLLDIRIYNKVRYKSKKMPKML